jgi:hypothetical protein
MWYVNILGIPDKYLEILGYFVVLESEEFKIYRDYYGVEQIVRKEKPYLYVHDINDRNSLIGRSEEKEVIASPPKAKNGH